MSDDRLVPGLFAATSGETLGRQGEVAKQHRWLAARDSIGVFGVL